VSAFDKGEELVVGDVSYRKVYFHGQHQGEERLVFFVKRALSEHPHFVSQVAQNINYPLLCNCAFLRPESKQMQKVIKTYIKCFVN